MVGDKDLDSAMDVADNGQSELDCGASRKSCKVLEWSFEEAIEEDDKGRQSDRFQVKYLLLLLLTLLLLLSLLTELI